MTSAVNVRSQLIGGILVVISLIIQCDGQTDCGPGKVLENEVFIFSQTNTLILIAVIAHKRRK